MRGSACVEVMTTLHGSAPSLRRRAEGCIPPEGMIASTRDTLKSTLIHSRGGALSGSGFHFQSGYSFVDQSRGQISSGSDTPDMDQQVVRSISSRPPWLLSRRLWLALGRRLVASRAGHLSLRTRYPMTRCHLHHPTVPSVHQASPYVLHGHSEIAPL
ncbi:hypothetical protein CK203_065096 [Vitis vinifera]|uniref:Uncharacterized protein n=1 Tax=Vitis vinifera TaxID=29760 RepID=A0A438G2Q8_VITVI|nr:hypothetical protein CK203_065096 [Vitis vinifera]